MSALHRIASSPPGLIAGALVGQVQASRLPTADTTVAQVREALLRATSGEDEWRARIEGRRAHLESSSETVTFAIDDPEWWVRAIEVTTDPNPPVLRGNEVDRNVGELTRRTSKAREWGVLFYRLARRLTPARCVELGTSVGMSGSYIAAALSANGAGRLVTIEGQQPSADIATAGFAQLGVADHVQVVVGQFGDVLPGVLDELGGVDLAFIDGHHLYQPTLDYFDAISSVTAPGGLLVFDDIAYWHEGMKEAWDEIAADRRVTGTVTVAGVGFAVVGGRRVGDYEVVRLPIR